MVRVRIGQPAPARVRGCGKCCTGWLCGIEREVRVRVGEMGIR
jgi:hypothetical protein